MGPPSCRQPSAAPPAALPACFSPSPTPGAILGSSPFPAPIKGHLILPWKHGLGVTSAHPLAFTSLLSLPNYFLNSCQIKKIVSITSWPQLQAVSHLPITANLNSPAFDFRLSLLFQQTSCSLLPGFLGVHLGPLNTVSSPVFSFPAKVCTCAQCFPLPRVFHFFDKSKADVAELNPVFL